ncbi:hypothetical protein [Parablautia intestinalis]|jgi:hypothetical protein|uniref:hypothetical protein n=1 Tax=Parablautia intestinalis TaxID=2320100 RepID=UPI00256EE6AC|nr:hypothetical protein [Parablautia intestinalis]
MGGRLSIVCAFSVVEKAKIVLKFHGKGKIIYKNKGKKGYWVKVHVPSKKVSGWIKHSCIQKNVWKKIRSS